MSVKSIGKLIEKKRRENFFARTLGKLSIAVLAFGGAGLAVCIYFLNMSKKESKETKNKVLSNVKAINDVFQEKSEAVMDLAENVVNKVSDNMNDIQRKKMRIEKDVDKGYKKIKHDLSKTVHNIERDEE